MMTDQEMRVAIATHLFPQFPIVYERGIPRHQYPHKNNETGPVANYPYDLNAMHEAEKMLGDKWREYMPILHEICGRTVSLCIHATARQRAEAFCRTLFPERFKE